MYSPKIQPEHVSRLYWLKASLNGLGKKVNMVELVKEAIESYLTLKEKELTKKGRGLLLVGKAKEYEIRH